MAKKTVKDVQKMKISDWCNQNTDSHGCYDAVLLADAFKKATGFDAPWKGYSVSTANKSVGQPKGLERPIDAPPNTMVVDGHSIVYNIWRKYCGKDQQTIDRLMGRGSIWSACIKAMSDDGK